MKIICIGHNYNEHINEMNSEKPEKPLFFLKPDSCILKNNNPFFLPSFSNEIHHEVELVVRINKLGKNIKAKFASTYYDTIGLGIDFTARDLQEKCKQKGNPWEISKCFDFSAPVSPIFIDINELDLNNIPFSLLLNGKIVQKSNSSDMIFSINEIITYVSKYMTLKIGDLIFTGTPAGVGPVAIGDKLEAFIGDEKLLDFNVK